MILVDTSIWIDHFRRRDDLLSEMLGKRRVLIHACVIGELALGNLSRRLEILSALRRLQRTPVATDDEVQRFIEEGELFGLGIGYVDAHLLAAVKLMPGSRLWTRDKRLLKAAERLAVAASLTH